MIGKKSLFTLVNLTLLVMTGLFQAGQCLGAAEGPVVKYDIEARLIPDRASLMGAETLTWMNSSREPVDILRFHLYYNAFRNEKSTFFQEAKFFRKSEEELKEYRFGEIKIREVRVLGGEELTEKIRYVSPDDQNPHDRTVMEVSLEKPVLPGESIRVKIDFVLTIPQIFENTGREGDYFFMAQWFPKIGVLEEDGRWNCHQYHRHTEYFSDFGEYRVALNIPEEFIIGATGNLTDKEKNADGTYTYSFEEKNIHDFAWTASPHFTKTVEEIKLEGNDESTTIILLLSPHHSGARQRYLSALKFAMNFFAEHIFPYPYKNITVVDPPLAALRSGGMEYPTLITTIHLDLLPRSIKTAENVVIHEFGHQYWYGMVANDESREAWLDEGVTTFFEMEILDAYFQESASLIDSSLIKINEWEIKRLGAVSLEAVNRVNSFSWHFLNGSYYANNVYDKAAIFLRSLRNYVGKEKMYGFFRFYAEQFKFKHPSTADFIQTFNLYMKDDFSWAFDQFINGESGLDHSVFKVESIKIGSNPGRYRNEAVFLRNEGYFPVEILIKLKNGEEIKHFWEKREKWKKIVFTHRSPIDYAVLDPKFKIPLDKNLVNNSKALNSSGRGIWKWAARLGFYFQNILGFLPL